jgi:hypothetical protein
MKLILGKRGNETVETAEFQPIRENLDAAHVWQEGNGVKEPSAEMIVESLVINDITLGSAMNVQLGYSSNTHLTSITAPGKHLSFLQRHFHLYLPSVRTCWFLFVTHIRLRN